MREVINYLETDLAYTLKDLARGLLNRLNFDDNFNAFTAEITVPSGGADLAIRNRLDRTPVGKIIVRDGGANTVVDGDTAWSNDFVYLKNTGGSDVTVTVVFYA